MGDRGFLDLFEAAAPLKSLEASGDEDEQGEAEVRRRATYTAEDKKKFFEAYREACGTPGGHKNAARVARAHMPDVPERTRARFIRDFKEFVDEYGVDAEYNAADGRKDNKGTPTPPHYHKFPAWGPDALDILLEQAPGLTLELIKYWINTEILRRIVVQVAPELLTDDEKDDKKGPLSRVGLTLAKPIGDYLDDKDVAVAFNEQAIHSPSTISLALSKKVYTMKVVVKAKTSMISAQAMQARMLYVSKLLAFLKEGDTVEVFLDEMPVYQSAGRLKGQRAVTMAPPGGMFTAKTIVGMAVSPTLGPVSYSVLPPVKSGRVWR